MFWYNGKKKKKKVHSRWPALLARLLGAPQPSKQCNQLEARSQDMNCGRYYAIKPSLWSLINVPSHAHLGWNEWVNQKVVKPSFVMLCIKPALKVLLTNRCQWLEKKTYMKAKIPSSKYKEAKVKGYKENKGEKKWGSLKHFRAYSAWLFFSVTWSMAPKTHLFPHEGLNNGIGLWLKTNAEIKLRVYTFCLQQILLT